MTTSESIKPVLRYISQRWFSGIGSIAVSVLVLLAHPPIVLSAEPDIGSITATQGVVVLKRPGVENAVAVTEGMAFKVGDVVETGERSTAQMTLSDDSFMNLGPATSVRVSQYSYDATTERRTTIIRIIEGKIRFVIYKLRSPGSSFRVETENGLITTGGLADFIVVASRGRAEVAVLDRGLTVRNSLPYIVGDVRVGVNQRTIIQDKSAPTIPVVITTQERKQWLKDLKHQ